MPGLLNVREEIPALEIVKSIDVVTDETTMELCAILREFTSLETPTNHRRLDHARYRFPHFLSSFANESEEALKEFPSSPPIAARSKTQN